MHTSNGKTPECLPKGMLVAAWTALGKGCRACERTGRVVVYLCVLALRQTRLAMDVCAGKARSRQVTGDTMHISRWGDR